MRIPFSVASLDETEIQAVADVLRSGWLTTGPKVHAFEEAFAQYVGMEYAVACCSCTAGLHVAVDALGLSPGNGVITTPFTFAATSEVVRYQGGHPVFVDIDPLTLNMRVDQAAMLTSEHCIASAEDAVRVGLPRGTAKGLARVTDSIVGTIPVHFAGEACDMNRVSAIARTQEWFVVGDAAHALETKSDGKSVAVGADATAYSFYATKNLTTGEGGMVVTDDAALAERMRRLTLHGISKDAWKRYTGEGSWYYEILEVGYKYNMTDISAAIGLVQLEKVPAMQRRREEIVDTYSRLLEGVDGLTVPRIESSSGRAWHLYVVRLDREPLAGKRGEFIELLAEMGIGTSVHFIPLHLHPYYQLEYGYERGDFPVAEAVYDACVSLPLYPSLSDDDVEYVCTCVRKVAERLS